MAALIERQVPPQDPQAQQVARRWMLQLEQDTAADPGLFSRLDAMHGAEPALRQQTGVSREMRDYVLVAFAEHRLAIYARHLTAAELERMRAHYAESMCQWPGLLAELQSLKDAGVPVSDPRVQALARRWIALFHAYAGPDPLTRQKIRRAEEQEPELRSGAWVDPGLLAYLGQAVTGLAPA